MSNQKKHTFISSKAGKKLAPHKESLTDQVRSGLQETGPYQEPDAKSGISGISTTAFISSAMLTAIGFGLRDGFFHSYTTQTMLRGVVLFFLNVLLALVLIVSGVVIFQTIKDSKASRRNLRIYWFILILAAVILIALL